MGCNVCVTKTEFCGIDSSVPELNCEVVFGLFQVYRNILVNPFISHIINYGRVLCSLGMFSLFAQKLIQTDITASTILPLQINLAENLVGIFLGLITQSLMGFQGLKAFFFILPDQCTLCSLCLANKNIKLPSCTMYQK